MSSAGSPVIRATRRNAPHMTVRFEQLGGRANFVFHSLCELYYNITNYVTIPKGAQSGCTSASIDTGTSADAASR